ncbi:unnamed protein product [Adineta ricciae]|uniref:Uncharacterized protein n=1 Tax=Adineta ricciae TaxID=249248 RepID=A0A815G5C8_ADIRI|nr:unnamed protein product [Adineta ricciae]CAF1676702.1 unnamed protein product [Adineta ricciae]
MLSKLFLRNPQIYLLPGVTPKTIETCSCFLQDNHEKYHIFFNEDGFHNHTTHHLLAALGLGASCETLERIYEQKKKIQQPIPPLHDRKDFDAKKCLGDETYYPDYVKFFTEKLENDKYQGNIQALIEDYFFNDDYLTLALGGAYHSLIHLGYALEFESKLMAIEGLAMAAVDSVGVQGVLKHMDYGHTPANPKTALEIVELITKDQRFDDKLSYNDKGVKLSKLLERNAGPLVAEYAQMWKCDVDDLRRADILVTAAAIREKKEVHLDFFLMHATTSSLFLNIFVHAFQNPENQTKFLKAKFAVDLLQFVARGRPKLNVNYLLNEHQISKEHQYADVSNPWLPLINKCLTHHDEHVPKTIRALVYAEKFDQAQGKDQISYLKIAQVVMDALFPEKDKDWVHEGIGWEEFWSKVKDL